MLRNTGCRNIDPKYLYTNPLDNFNMPPAVPLQVQLKYCNCFLTVIFNSNSYFLFLFDYAIVFF